MVAAALLLTACIPNNVRQGDTAVYVFATPTGEWPERPALHDVHVTAPSWLGSSAMQYRLRYHEPDRRQAYVESRWAAAPAELLEQALRRRMLSRDTGTVGKGCSVEVQLDEFEQSFDSAQVSRIVIAARAVLRSHADQPFARQSLIVERTAPTPDARGGVAATSLAVQGLSDELGDWLRLLAHDIPTLDERCRGR